MGRDSRNWPPRKTFKLKSKFIKTITKPDGDDGCWLWIGYKVRGYGRIWYDGRQRLATHLSLELFKGGIAEGLCACHTCDTPACVNPSHLFVGTKKDNIYDMIAKGRSANQGKLSSQQIDEIISLPEIKRGELAAVAVKYGVSASYISALRNRGSRKKRPPAQPISLSIRCERDIDSAAARELRRRSGLPQHAFWGALGVTQACGARYEATQPIPKTMRILILITYVIGISFDASSTDEVAAAAQMYSSK